MAQIVDSYSEDNADTYNSLSTSIPAYGQSFTGDGGVLNSVKFCLNKSNSPTGNAYAKIYAHSGTFGTDSIPTGNALAISGAFDVSTLTADRQLITFTFSGANKITLTNGTKYVVVFEFNGSNVSVSGDGSSPSHGGNYSFYFSPIMWAGSSSQDLIFYVYKDDVAIPTQTIQAKANIISISTKVVTISSKARLEVLNIKTLEAKANIYRENVSKVILVSPENEGSGDSPVIFVWEIPTTFGGENVHSHIQIDKTSDAFGDIEFEQKSWEDQTNMEYWDGSQWQPYPAAGVSQAYAGNQARITGVSLTIGNKWWRVRGGIG